MQGRKGWTGCILKEKKGGLIRFLVALSGGGCFSVSGLWRSVPSIRPREVHVLLPIAPPGLFLQTRLEAYFHPRSQPLESLCVPLPFRASWNRHPFFRHGPGFSISMASYIFGLSPLLKKIRQGITALQIKNCPQSHRPLLSYRHRRLGGDVRGGVGAVAMIAAQRKYKR